MTEFLLDWAWLVEVRSVICDWSVVMFYYREAKLTAIVACIWASVSSRL